MFLLADVIYISVRYCCSLLCRVPLGDIFFFLLADIFISAEYCHDTVMMLAEYCQDAG
jgi:hypothetical protein